MTQSANVAATAGTSTIGQLASKVDLSSGSHSTAQIHSMASGAKFMPWPKHSPAVNVPFFDEGMCKSVNLDTEASELPSGLDLPLNDMTTLRFFFNLGVQQSRVVLLQQHLATTQQRQHTSSASIPAAAVSTAFPLQQTQSLQSMMQTQHKQPAPPAAAPLLQQQLASPLSFTAGLTASTSHQTMNPAASNATMNGHLLLIKRPALHTADSTTQGTYSANDKMHSVPTTSSKRSLPVPSNMTKSTPEIIIVSPQSQTSTSSNVSGFIPLTPQQQATIDRMHLQLAAATASPSGSASSRPSRSSPARVDDRESMDTESPPLGPMLMFSYLNSSIGQRNSFSQQIRVPSSAVDFKNLLVRERDSSPCPKRLRIDYDNSPLL